MEPARLSLPWKAKSQPLDYQGSPSTLDPFKLLIRPIFYSMFYSTAMVINEFFDSDFLSQTSFLAQGNLT